LVILYRLPSFDHRTNPLLRNISVSLHTWEMRSLSAISDKSTNFQGYSPGKIKG